MLHDFEESELGDIMTSMFFKQKPCYKSYTTMQSAFCININIDTDTFVRGLT